MKSAEVITSIDLTECVYITDLVIATNSNNKKFTKIKRKIKIIKKIKFLKCNLIKTLLQREQHKVDR